MTPPVAPEGSGLAVEELVVRYSGNLAVDRLTLEAPIGRITGLIGPNGAGKTTTFNACSGLVRSTSGSIRFAGVDLTRRSAAARARAGLGRTFQHMLLYSSMTVAENVALGREATLAGAHPLRQFIASRSDRVEIARATAEALELCDLEAVAGVAVDTLPTGSRRLVELARAYAGGYPLLLLDEPSSGLDRAETERFGEILRTMVERRGIGILLIEHDMSLVMGVCEYIYVLDFGVLIFEGRADETRASATVRDAYLGSADLEERVS
jgi:ABC-type branched-subunit amino acid transport system ATPase component